MSDKFEQVKRRIPPRVLVAIGIIVAAVITAVAVLRGGTAPDHPSPQPSGSASSGPSGSPSASPSQSAPAGAWPGPDNTGVPADTALTAYTGSCIITIPDMVIDSKRIDCDLIIRAPGVTISKSRIAGNVSTGEDTDASVTIVDSEIDAGKRRATGVGADNFIVLRSEVVGGNQGIYCRRDCTVQDSWIHGTYVESDWHASAVRMEQGSRIIHNTLACDWLIPTKPLNGGCSANLAGYGDFAPVKDNLIERNLFVANPTGAAYCAYGGASPGKPYSAQTSGIKFKDNTFERGSNRKCAAYGPMDEDSWAARNPGNLWENNVWADDGTAVKPS